MEGEALLTYNNVYHVRGEVMINMVKLLEPMVDFCGEMMLGYRNLVWGTYDARDRMIPTLVPLVAGEIVDLAYL